MNTAQDVANYMGRLYIFDSGAVAYSNAYFGRGSGPYHLDDVYCSGTESSLLSCNRRYSIGVHDCRPGNEAGVNCCKCMMHITGSALVVSLLFPCVLNTLCLVTVSSLGHGKDMNDFIANIYPL